ncbi:MAG TPA: hypothetical protein VL981_00445 [Candidatus Methylacidiphilales bacterium]|nr:hypothetical protein [Candidatus Methylacidiphilales bacterium]
MIFGLPVVFASGSDDKEIFAPEEEADAAFVDGVEAAIIVLALFLWDDMWIMGKPSGAIGAADGALVDGGGFRIVTSSSAKATAPQQLAISPIMMICK